jgi:hypothetical protein
MKLEAPIVLFTSAEMVDILKTMRGDRPLYCIVRPFEQIDSWILYQDEWKAQHALDPEASIHSPELYAIWAAKPFFVNEAITVNPFQAEKFFWCDIGVFREGEPDIQILQNFPLASRLPTDRILLNSVLPLNDDDVVTRPDGIYGDFLRRDRIVGGLWGGDKHGCKRWLAAYESMLIRYFTAGRFAGKDQSVMLSALLENPTLATVVRCNTAGNPWFHLTRLLSNPTIQFELDSSYIVTRSEPPVSIQILGGLGNQMFQIAAAFAYARRHGGKFLLEEAKRHSDRRAIYWDSALYRFYHVLGDRIDEKPLAKMYDRASTVFTNIPPLPPQGLWIEGYFQTGLYFAEIRREMLYLMQPSASVLRHIHDTFSELLAEADRVVVVHCRRTDYCESDWNIRFHGPLSVEYYRTAMERMCSEIADPVFLLCGDDPLFWVNNMNELPALKTHKFHMMTNESDINTLALLQQFSHFIIANSSFSWWAANLASLHKKPRVIAPAQWFGPAGPTRYEDVYDPSWEKV